MENDCSKGVSPKRKNGDGSSFFGPVRRARPVGCVPEQLHLFPREGCRGRHGEAATVTSSGCCSTAEMFYSLKSMQQKSSSDVLF